MLKYTAWYETYSGQLYEGEFSLFIDIILGLKSGLSSLSPLKSSAAMSC